MVVSNATALIAFARIKRLDILTGVLGELVIPQAVSDELTIAAGLIDQVKPLLDAMVSQDFWISKRLYLTFLEQVGELP